MTEFHVESENFTHALTKRTLHYQCVCFKCLNELYHPHTYMYVNCVSPNLEEQRRLSLVKERR